MLGVFRRNPAQDVALRLHKAISDRSRAPVFFTVFGVPDTIDGRFDLFALHAFFVLDAIKQRGAAGADLGARLATLVFAGLEDALRDLGVSDFGMSRRIKAMADAFYGRLDAYAAAGNETEIAMALLKNLYRGEPGQAANAAALAPYVQDARLRIAQTLGDAGAVDFGPLPERAP